MDNLFSLGSLYLSNFIPLDKNSTDYYKSELSLINDQNNIIRLNTFVEPNLMYTNYWYQSNTNNGMKLELKNIVDSVISVNNYNKINWLDIGCNDGSLFEYVDKNIIKYGCDPSDIGRNIGSKKCDFFYNSFFSKKLFSGVKFQIITAVAMFYDLAEPEKFLADIYDVLDTDGIFIIQMSYLPLMIKQLAFDNICHEHLYYYTLTSLDRLLNNQRFKIVDCELNTVNGGSFRIYIQKVCASPKSFADAPRRYVSDYRVDSIFNTEVESDSSHSQTFSFFKNNVDILKNKCINFIRNQQPGSVIGLGASTKGNTLLQYFGLDNSDIKFIIDKQDKKHNLKTIGSEIPILSESYIESNLSLLEGVKYALVLPWHFINSFKNIKMLKDKCKLIVPCPDFEIL